MFYPFRRSQLGVAIALCFTAPTIVHAQEQTSDITTLQNIVVSASGFEQNIKEAPASISVLTREDLERRSFKDLADALRDIEGIDVKQSTGKTGNMSISIRGMPSDYTLILVDGRRQNTAGSVTPNGFGDTATGFIPPVNAIERIEIIRGPMSTLYGSDAMGGVVNIITRKVASEWGGSLLMETAIAQKSSVGTRNKAQIYVSGPVVDDLVGISIRGLIERRGKTTLKPSNGNGVISNRGPAPTEGRNHSIGAKLTLTPNQNNDIWLDVEQDHQWFNNSECELGTLDGYGRNDCVTPAPTTAYGYADNLRFNREQIAIGQTTRFATGTLETSLMRNTTTTKGRTIPGTIGIIPWEGTVAAGDERKLKTTNTIFDAKYVTPLGDSHLLTLGGQYWKAQLKDGLVPDTFKQTMHAIFVEDEYSITSDLIATVGLRYDYHDAFKSHFSPRGYLVWNANPNWTIKGGVSKGYRTPSLNQLHDGINSVSGQGSNINIGNPSLKPETSISKEIGAHYDSRNMWAAGVTLFQNDIKNLFDSARCSTNPIAGCQNLPSVVTNDPSFPVNAHKASTHGLEFYARANLTENWSLSGNYTWTESKVKKEGMDTGEMTNTPKHMGQVTLRWEDDQDTFSAWLTSEYRGKSARFTSKPAYLSEDERRELAAVGNFKSYTVFNLGGQYKVNKNVTLTANVDNLLNKDFLKFNPWVDTKNVTQWANPYFRSSAGTSGSLPSFGRTFWLSANISF